jgi:hypothetical protein
MAAFRFVVMPAHVDDAALSTDRDSWAFGAPRQPQAPRVGIEDALRRCGNAGAPGIGLLDGEVRDRLQLRFPWEDLHLHRKAVRGQIARVLATREQR